MPGGTLDRRTVVAELLKGRDELLVVTGLGSASYDAMAAGDDEHNFYLWAAMGSAATVGFGLAMAQLDRPVLVLTGDGEMLMGLGAIASIAQKRPPQSHNRRSRQRPLRRDRNATGSYWPRRRTKPDRGRV